LVFDTVSTDKITFQSQRVLNVVSLDDRSTLGVVGKVAMPGKSAYIAAYADYKGQLIVLLWDRVEIYDLTDPTKPRFVQAHDLGDQGFSSPGHPLIEPVGEGKFNLLNTSNTTELAVVGSGWDWRVTPLARPTPAQKSRMEAPAIAVLTLRQPTDTPLLVHESDKFRYEVSWIDKRQPGIIVHRKYLRQFDKASGRPVARLLLEARAETID
jgi:hypothetical protein